MDASVSGLLQRSNLTQYETPLLEQGADDLQQLMEVSEEELQGLIKSVGMDSKPFHVMRFRKALGRYLPAGMVREDSLTSFTSSIPPTVTVFASRIDPLSMNPPSDHTSSMSSSSVCYNPSSIVTLAPTPSSVVTISSTPPPPPSSTISTPHSDGDEVNSNARKVVQIEVTSQQLEQIVDDTTPVQLRLGPSPVSPDVWDAGRKELIRSSSQVFTNSNSRKRGHELTEHETFMNAAAYQLCLWDPTLLVRRDELFTLAKKLVHESSNSKAIQVKYSDTSNKNSRMRGSPYPLHRGTDGKFKACFEVNFDLRERQISEVERLLAENVAEEQVKQVLLSEAKRQKDYSSVLQLQEEIATLGQTYRQLRTQLSKIRRKQRRSVRHQEMRRMKTDEDHETTLADKYPALQLPILPPELTQGLTDTTAMVAATVPSRFTGVSQQHTDTVSKEISIPAVITSDDMTISSNSSAMPQVQTSGFPELGMKSLLERVD